MYVHIFGYLVNKLEIRWVYLSPIEKTQFNGLFQTKAHTHVHSTQSKIQCLLAIKY